MSRHVLIKFWKILFLLLPVFLLFPAESGAEDDPPWESYRPKLEMEMLYPVLYYDEQDGFLGLLYGQMSDVLREHDLRFIFYINEWDDEAQYVVGYTRHLGLWSIGANLYSGPVYLGCLWSPGFSEYQNGLSLLASYHWNNESRIDFRLQWEKFETKAYSLVLKDLPEDGKVVGWDITLNQDTHDLLAQNGTRQYLSVGGAFPIFGTDYDYLKIEGDHRSYHPLGKRLSLIWSARAGKIWGDYPSHRGFLVGGIQHTSASALGSLINTGLLGFLSDSVLRGYDTDAFVGDSFVISNLELRGLLWPGDYYNIGGFACISSLFIDAGQIWRQQKQLASKPPAAYGVGLKFLILRGLMLGIDYAVPFDPGEDAKWHFSLGEVF
ncbi:MAG TPA: BamA/TamA family outer membrane protein [Bacillota bacterium]